MEYRQQQYWQVESNGFKCNDVATAAEHEKISRVGLEKDLYYSQLILMTFVSARIIRHTNRLLYCVRPVLNVVTYITLH